MPFAKQKGLDQSTAWKNIGTKSKMMLLYKEEEKIAKNQGATQTDCAPEQVIVEAESGRYIKTGDSIAQFTGKRVLR